MPNHFKNKKAETILEVTIALFVMSTMVTVSTTFSGRIMNHTGQRTLWGLGQSLALEGLDAVRNVSDTNRLRYTDPECWKTIETANVCDPLTSPMMASSSDPIQYYSTFFDHVDFTWSLDDPMELGQSNLLFNDSAIVSRVPNKYSIYKKFLGSDDTKPIYTGKISGAEKTPFYRRIRVESTDTNLDGVEDLIVTSQVKWPYKSKVFTYTISEILTDFSE